MITITEENIAEVVSLWTGIPAKKISEDDLEKILRGNERLKNKVSSYLGQVFL